MVPTFFLELGGALIVLAFVARLARHFGFTPIPLYLLTGLLFNSVGLIPVGSVRELIDIGAEIGVVLLLFLLGLEYTAQELLGNIRVSAKPGLINFLLNFTPGFIFGFILGFSPLAAVLLGGATYVSSSGIIAKLLSDLGRLSNRETPIVLSILVIEDLTLAIYLPIVASLVLGGTLITTIISLVIALTVVISALFFSARLGPLLSRILFSPSDEVLLLSVLGLTLVISGLAEKIGISAAIGSFLLGIALSNQAAEHARRLVQPLRDLFAAAFFLFFGLSINPAGILTMLVPAIILVVITSATKLFTGYWAARKQGIGLRGSLRAGAVLTIRGEFSILIAGLGVTAGIEPRLGPLAASYVLILAFLGPILARFIENLVKKKK